MSQEYADFIAEEIQRDMDRADYIEQFGITPEQAKDNAAEAMTDAQRDEENQPTQ